MHRRNTKPFGESDGSQAGRQSRRPLQDAWEKRAYGGTSYSASMASSIARCALLSASRYFTAAEAEFWAQIVALVLDGYRIQ